MAEQLASVPEGSTTDSTLSPACCSYDESIWRNRSAQRGSAGVGAWRNYLFNISSSAKQLSSLSEESNTTSTSPCPPAASYSYREWIRSVAWPEWLTRSALSSHSGYSGSNDSSVSGASSSSSGSASASAVDFGADELRKIAHIMISDGYTQRIVRAFKYGGGAEQFNALETWFTELDISWILQMQELKDMSASYLEELVERWTRALTIIVFSIKELFAAVHEELAVGRFGKASISPMLDFVALVDDYKKVEKLQTIVHMYICVSSASYDICTKHLISSEAQSIFDQIGASLETEENRLIRKLSSWMWLAKQKLLKKKHDDSWAIEIVQGGAKVHSNTRLMANCIVLMRKALVLTQNSAQSQNTEKLRKLIDGTTEYLKDLLLQKSKLCSDPSLRYLFLLNNTCFAAQVSEPLMSSEPHRGPRLLSDRQKYMDSYLEVSWGPVMSCISSSNFLGPLSRWINTSPLAKFQSAFHKTYQAQKFWKVPDPRIRSLLRETITKRVISGYYDYLKEHPELKKQVSGGSNSPVVFEKMLAELFEG